MTSSHSEDGAEDGVCDLDGLCGNKINVESDDVESRDSASDRNDVKDEFEEKRKKYPNCKMFKKSDYNASSPTLIYMESRGRLGNQVNKYIWNTFSFVLLHAMTRSQMHFLCFILADTIQLNEKCSKDGWMIGRI